MSVIYQSSILFIIAVIFATSSFAAFSPENTEIYPLELSHQFTSDNIFKVKIYPKNENNEEMNLIENPDVVNNIKCLLNGTEEIFKYISDETELTCLLTDCEKSRIANHFLEIKYNNNLMVNYSLNVISHGQPNIFSSSVIYPTDTTVNAGIKKLYTLIIRDKFKNKIMVEETDEIYDNIILEITPNNYNITTKKITNEGMIGFENVFTKTGNYNINLKYDDSENIIDLINKNISVYPGIDIDITKSTLTIETGFVAGINPEVTIAVIPRDEFGNLNAGHVIYSAVIARLKGPGVNRLLNSYALSPENKYHISLEGPLPYNGLYYFNLCDPLGRCINTDTFYGMKFP